jgi:hypothetical protein
MDEHESYGRVESGFVQHVAQRYYQSEGESVGNAKNEQVRLNETRVGVEDRDSKLRNSQAVPMAFIIMYQWQ